jgi:GT2 family glycosyltransferase
MNRGVTICIGTIGSPTFEKCKKIIDKLAAKSSDVKKVVVIKNKKPQSAWLNAMRNACKDTKWCLQVDEDMYLKDNAINQLLNFALKKEKEGIKILNASSLLYDLFLKKNIGSLKLWNSEALQQLEFRDVLGGDRDYAKRAKKFGYRNVETPKMLGYHDSAPTPKVAFEKYYEYTQKIKKFESEKSAKQFSDFLRRKAKRDGSFISKKAYDGSSHAIKDKIINKSKAGGIKNKDLNKSIIANVSSNNIDFLESLLDSGKLNNNKYEILFGIHKDSVYLNRIKKIKRKYSNLHIFIAESNAQHLILIDLANEALYDESIFKINLKGQLIPFEKRQKITKIKPLTKIKIGILTASWMRVDLTAKYCRHIFYLTKFFANEADIVSVIVDSDSHNKASANKNGLIYLNYKNQPLSNKFNFGMQYFKDKNIDAVMILGTDNFVCTDLFKKYIKIIRNKYDLVGVLDSHLYDTISDKMFYFPGYNNHRTGETVGAGRVLSAKLLKKLKYTPWQNGLSRNLDGSMWEKLKNLNIKEYKISTKNNDYLMLGVKTKIFLTNIKNFKNKEKANKKLLKKIRPLRVYLK